MVDAPSPERLVWQLSCGEDPFPLPEDERNLSKGNLNVFFVNKYKEVGPL